MGELLRVVELGNSYWLEYMNDSTNWQMKTKELSPSDARRYESLMEELQDAETQLLRDFTE
ncbi:hypothetical protein OAA60_05550 [Porticoccaceae bacterium]|nr:hypothetical protein [Porticoccaceae bacterium]